MESKKSESKMKANMVTVMKGSINGVELSDLNTDEINEPSASKTYTLENIETCIKRIYLHQTIHNKIIFGVFWSVLVCLLYSLVYTSQGSYENYFTVSNIRNSMVDTKDYNSLDFSEWFQGPFLDSFVVDEFGLDSLSEQNKIINILMLQHRTKEGHCKTNKKVKEFLLNNMIDQSDSATEGSNMEDYMDAHLCNAPYSSSSKSKEPFGPGGIWKYEETNYKKIDGRHTNYDGSGFIVHLSTDPDTFTEQTEFLKDNKWTDKSTRALTIIVTIVNPSTNTYTVGEFLLELPRGGDYLATPHYFVYRADFSKGLPIFIAYVVFLIINIITFTKDMIQLYRYTNPESKLYKRFISIFRHPLWNLYDFLLLILMIVLIPWYIVLCVDDLKSDVECIHCEVKKRADQQDNWLFTAAFCSFFGIISIFQNFTFIYHLSTLWSTLGRSFVSVVFFIIMFIIITLGFVVLGHVYYGSYLLQFSTTPFDFIHFISSIFEGLDYYELALYHPNMTIIFYMMFSFIVIAIMLNMFIAIVMNAYDDYKMEDSDLFGFYDIKISLIMFVTKTSKSLSVMEKIYTENKTLSLPHADFLHFVGDACHETSTGGYYPPDVKNVVKYIDIILYHDETLKKFEKQYFYENSCKLKFQRLVRRRMKTLGLTKSSEFVLASGTAPRNKPGNGSDGTLVATTQMVNDALAADNSELMSKGLTKTKPAKKESNETSPSGPSNSQ